jgi:hypothetical protein
MNMMEKQKTSIRSSISTAFMRRTLLRGTILGGIGIAALLAGGVFVPADEMRKWGPFLFLFSAFMITLGLLPYKKLKRLEEKPYLLTIEGDEWLHLFAEGKMLFSIPIPSIDHIEYIDGSDHYGIAVFLKHPLPAKLKVEDPNFDLAAFYQRSLNRHQCDLFLSYFSRRSFNALQECGLHTS